MTYNQETGKVEITISLQAAAELSKLGMRENLRIDPTVDGGGFGVRAIESEPITEPPAPTDYPDAPYLVN